MTNCLTKNNIRECVRQILPSILPPRDSDMGVIKNILEEERERLSRLCEKYSEEIRKLPKGSISKKARGGKRYAYLAYRESHKVKFRYVGEESSEEASRLERQIEERRRYERSFRQAGRDLREVERTIRGRKA